MFKRPGIIFFVGLLILFIFTPTNHTTFSIQFNALGGSPVPTYVGTRDALFSMPTPYKENALFEGWYLEEIFETRYDDGSLKKDLTLYAKWKDINALENVFHMTHERMNDGLYQSTLYVNGQVEINAYDIEIFWDEGITLDSYETSLNQVVNGNLDGRIRFNYIDLLNGITHPQAILIMITKGTFIDSNNFEIKINEAYSYDGETIEKVTYTID